MSAIYAVPVLLGILTTVLVGLIGWGLLQASRRTRKGLRAGSRDPMLLGMLLLAAFSLGAFATVLLLSVMV